MNTGWLTQRIELQSATETRNAYGEATAVWATYATVWGGVQPVRGVERVAAQQTQADEETKVIIRYRTDVSVKHRVKHGSRYLSVNAVINPRSSNERLELMCTEDRE